jgi:hypothetical protein
MALAEVCAQTECREKVSQTSHSTASPGLRGDQLAKPVVAIHPCPGRADLWDMTGYTVHALEA